MSLKKVILAGVLSATALVNVAIAEDAAMNDYYVQLNAGASVSAKAGGDVSKKMGTSGLYGLEAGTRLNENLRMGLSIDYRPSYLAKTSSSKTEDGDKHNTNIEYKVKSLVAMANVYYDITEINGFTPYMNFGLGVAKNQLKYTSSTVVQDISGVYNESIKSNKTNFAYKVGLGTRYSVSQAVDLDLRYQFADLGKFKVNSSDGLKKGKLRAHEFLVGVAYKF
jgi:opacity protein-like surface antigen